MAEEILELIDHDDGYLLRQTDKNGKVSEIILSENSLLQLGQSALQTRVSILARQSLPGVNRVVVTPIAQAGLNTDLEQDEIHLTLYARDGTDMTFSLPLGVAKPLAERLPVRTAEIEEAIRNRKIQ